MKEIWNKLVIYFTADSMTYWRIFSIDEVLPECKNYTPYYIDIRPRLADGHYKHLDFRSFSTSLDVGRKCPFQLTTLLGYSLAQHQLYLSSGDEELRSLFLSCCSLILSLCEYQGRRLHLLQKNDPRYGTYGSAMILGEFFSVLIRAYEMTHEQKYLDTCQELLWCFETEIQNGGVKAVFRKGNCFWYEEIAKEPVCHVLNGMIYSLLGLHDYATTTQNERAEHLFNQGVQWLEDAIHLFVYKNWSLYYVPEDTRINKYISSMMYHNLHICQLRVLANMTGRKRLHDISKYFEGVASSHTNRIWSGLILSKQKIRNSLYNRKMRFIF